jgi:hypothetical protein
MEQQRHCTVFAPAADFLAATRPSEAGQSDCGRERFITATRRQNFLIPPRRHRAFPFAELRGGGWADGAAAGSGERQPKGASAAAVLRG